MTTMEPPPVVVDADAVYWTSVCGNESLTDAFWSPALTVNTQNPDFTSCFQNTVCVWVPCGLFILLGLFEARSLSHQPTIRHRAASRLNNAKLVISLLLVLVTLLDLLKSFGELFVDRPAPQALFIKPTVYVISFILSSALIRYEFKKGVVSGGLLFCFWLMLLTFGAITFRSLVINYNPDAEPFIDYMFRFASFYVYFTLVLVEFVLSLFPDIAAIANEERTVREERRPLLETSDKEEEKEEPTAKPCPELTAPFWSRFLFLWISGMIFRGYRRVLTFADLWQLMPEDRCDHILPDYEEQWKREVQKHNFKMVTKSAPSTYQVNGNKFDSTPVNNYVPSTDTEQPSSPPPKKKRSKEKGPSFWNVIVRSSGAQFMIGGIYKLVYDVISFVNPQILNLLITFVSTGGIFAWQGYVYAVMLFVISMTRTIFLQYYWHRCYVTGMNLRTAVTGVVYRKALKLSSAARADATVGEIVNLMSVDSQKLQDAPAFLHMLWSTPLTIAIAMFFLWQQLGPATLAGLVLMILLVPVNAVIAQKTRSLQVTQMGFKDNRIKMMNEVLNGVKVIKLYAWEDSFRARVMDIRDDELRVLKTAAFLSAGSSLSWFMAPYLVALGSFTVFVLSSPDNVLDANKAFVSLSLFNLMNYPLSILPAVIAYGVQASVSIGRITRFLKKEETDPDNVGPSPPDGCSVSVSRGTFSWGAKEEPVLRNIDLEVKEGQLVGVVGTVGAGKSSLISALLGDMHVCGGRVNIRGSVAYVPQQAWIQNASLRDNIYFGSPVNERKYQQVIEASALAPDLKILPGGDYTEIGEKGINLSGGQKQRVSLARAVYQNTDVYLLDDPLSAVDSHVGKHIFREVIGPTGMLKNKTRILVTNSITHLSQMDVIVTLRSGVVSEVGTYTELLSHNGAFADFIQTYLKETPSSEEEDEEVLEIRSQLMRTISTMSGTDQPLGEHQSEKSGSRLSSRKSRPRSRSIKSKATVQQGEGDEETERKPNQKNKLIEEEVAQSGSVKLSLFLGYLRCYGKGMSIGTFFFYLLFIGTQCFTNIWLSWWSTDPAPINGTVNTQLRDLRLGVYGGLGVAQAIGTLGQAFGIALGCINCSFILHSKLLTSIMRAPMSFFDTTPLGRIVNRFSRDVDVLDINLPLTIRILMSTFSVVITTIFVICYSTPIFLAVFVPLAIFYFFVQRFYINTSRQLKRIDSVRRSPLYTHFSESITGVASIRAYGQIERFIQKSDTLTDENQMAYYPNIVSNRWLGIWLEFTGNMIVLFSSMFAVIERDNINGGLAGLSVSYALQVTGALNMMVRMSSDMENYIVAVERIQEYTECPQEAPAIVPGNRPSRNWPDEGKVEFRKYSTRYRPGLDLVLREIMCSVNPGEKVGIVGRTGAGKSSLTLALFRIIEAAAGDIIIDGQNISRIGLHDLRSKLTIIPQDPVLFSGTLRSNLDPFERHADAEVWLALEQAHLKAYVSSLPDQLEHKCTEGGDNLSLGQRQLVCLARALLRKTKVLILDEATAAVDIETDELIQETIRAEFNDCTIITIAHRLNTIMDYDRVLVLDQGKVAEFDTLPNLLEDKRSKFYSMVKDAGGLPPSPPIGAQ